MKLYYHKTDGGAEYYCLRPIEKQPDGTDEFFYLIGEEIIKDDN